MTADFVGTPGSSIVDEDFRSVDSSPSDSSNHIEHHILGALLAMRDGDFSHRLPADWPDVHGRIAEVFNDIMRMSELREREIKRIALLVGKEGQLKQRINAVGMSGGWAEEIFDLNSLINDLVRPITELSRIIGDAASGDVSREMALEVDGRRLEGEYLRFAKQVNVLIGRLSHLLKAEAARMSSAIDSERAQPRHLSRDNVMDGPIASSVHAEATSSLPGMAGDEVRSADRSGTARESAVPTVDRTLAGNKILVVDDDVRNIFALTSFLEDKDAEVVCATNGFQAIEMVKANCDIDLILMDIMMPEMDGYQTIREIRMDSRFRSLPIIALTAKAMRGDREKCLEAGASDYISKPVNTDGLLYAVHAWLSR